VEGRKKRERALLWLAEVAIKRVSSPKSRFGPAEYLESAPMERDSTLAEKGEMRTHFSRSSSLLRLAGTPTRPPL